MEQSVKDIIMSWVDGDAEVAEGIIDELGLSLHEDLFIDIFKEKYLVKYE